MIRTAFPCRLGLRSVRLSGADGRRGPASRTPGTARDLPADHVDYLPKVSAFEPDEAKGKIDGFTPVFLAGSVRLIQAGICGRCRGQGTRYDHG